jgi:competence protein ComEC
VIPGLRPLVLVLLALLLGLLPALRFGSPSVLAPLAGCLGALAWSVYRSWGRVGPTQPLVSQLPLLAAFVCLGVALGETARAGAAADCRWLIYDGAPLEVQGVLGAGARSTSREGGAPLLPLERAELVFRDGVCRAPLRVRVPATLQAPAGTRVGFSGEWIRARARVSPSPWPADPYFAGFVAVDSVTLTAAPRPAGNPLLWARGRAELRLERLFPGHYTLAEALVLGRREYLDPALRERFVRAGLVHLLAISGAHVGLIAGMLLLAGNALRLRRRTVRLGTIASIATYLMLIGAPGSAVRAGIMLSLALLAGILQRPAATLPIMSAAALVLLVWEPMAALHPGVQLSFAGVAAIVLAGRLYRDRVPTGIQHHWSAPLIRATLASLFAFVLTAPITAHHFGTISPASIVSNLPAIPLISMALVAIVCSLLLAPLPVALLGLLADGGGAALDLLDRIATAAAAMPYGFLSTRRPDWALWTASLGAALLTARIGVKLSRWVRWCVAAGLALVIVLAWPAVDLRAGDTLEIHVLDVGQGDAFAIRTPRNRWLMIDAGPRIRDFDAGERRVLPFLRARGVSGLEALILTHPDADHIGGAGAIVRAIPVARIVEPGVAVGKHLYLDLLAAVEQKGVVWVRAHEGRAITIDGVELRFLWPDSLSRESGASAANDASVVVHLRYGSFAALFPGDIPAAVEREIVAREAGRIAAHVLLAGHHGSRTSTSDQWLDAVEPELVVISSGRRNRYGHPAPEVLARLAARGIQIARTDQEGTISLRVSSGTDFRWTRIAP